MLPSSRRREHTWSDGCCVSEVREHLILARLPLALLWHAMDSAAYAEHDHKPCQWAARHFEAKCNAGMNRRGGNKEKENRKKNNQAGAGKLQLCVWRDPGCLLAAGAPGWGVGARRFYMRSIGEGSGRGAKGRGGPLLEFAHQKGE